ncbi:MULTISPECIES: hypothetical protein [unclassified Spirosoma]|uniref:hypothetical protein n=1 Tax=unclassified Spirosoma TaxID=2621999 RepID=UPI00095CD8F1|nr:MULTISPECIES: hypothetical protein [unclassified Spirosoma]MBN8820715.1 hypothetical protein [Spirosoma sp.]OJW80327.1 MAG: hypothetical protein BGO59_33040 [Spirosoma sp. 48-14]
MKLLAYLLQILAAFTGWPKPQSRLLSASGASLVSSVWPMVRRLKSTPPILRIEADQVRIRGHSFQYG